MYDLPRVSYKPTSKRFVAERYKLLQLLKSQLWDIYSKKERVLVYDKEPHQQILLKGIKLIRIVDKDEIIYYCIDTSHEEYAEMGLPYVLECLLAQANKLEDFDEDKYKQAEEARANNPSMDR